ncbi:MAG: HAD family phosphatase [Gemmataceae bacterium]|nr:HAD family phosphatase [Gemmataceae bacterium]
MTSSPFAILWDVDGTLVDTAELHFQSWCTLAEELGKPFTRADFAGTFGWRNPEIIPKLFGMNYTNDEVAQMGDRKEDLYRVEAEKGVSLLPGVPALLTAATRLGVRQAIGSSAPRRNIDLILRLTQTHEHFAAIVAMEDTPRGKPDPEVFARGSRLLGIDPKRCVVLEDAPVGIQAAKSAGMRAIGVTFVAHHPAEKLRAAGADHVVHTLEEVTVEMLRELVG